MSELEGGSYFKTLSEDIDKRTAPTSPPPETPALSLPEISSGHSKELAAFVENNRDPAMKDLSQRWFEGKLSGDDLTVGLPNLQKEFLAAKKTIETSSNTLAREAFSLLKKNSPEFAQLCATNGDEVMAQSIEKGFVASGFSDPTRYSELHAHNARIEMVRKDLADQQKGIDDFCKKFGVTEEEFKRAMNGVNELDRKAMLKQYVKAH